METSSDHLYFDQTAFPCQFLIEVKEGFARMDVPNQDSLNRLMAYCNDQAYHVNWTRAVSNKEEASSILTRFPGGKYVASMSAPAAS